MFSEQIAAEGGSITHRTGPLAGLKVLDFGWALVGSLTGKYLGDHGAEVIRVESATRPDMTRVDRRFSKSSTTSLDDKPWFAHVNTSKRSLAIDLKNRASRPIIEGLIRWADVVNENFTPGTLDKLGYSADLMKRLNPDIILVSGSLFGQTGPLANEWGIDGTGAAISGRLNLTGWPDRTPITPNAGIFGDYVVPLVNGIAVMGALIRRARAGQGTVIDSSMYEISAQILTPAFLDYQVTGTLQQRQGNRVAHMAPHGVFPARGQDEWVAIAVETDAEWAALRQVLGNPPWACDPALTTLAGRKAAEDRIETGIADWTRTLDRYEAMHRLQAAGVPAGVVQTAGDVVERDPQLRHRQFLHPVAHPILGEFGHQVAPFRLSQTPAHPCPAPAMGEANDYVATGLLGLSDEEFVTLIAEEVFK